MWNGKLLAIYSTLTVRCIQLIVPQLLNSDSFTVHYIAKITDKSNNYKFNKILLKHNVLTFSNDALLTED